MRVIGSDDPAFAFQASDLSRVLSRELQPDACTETVGFVDNDHSEMVQTASDGFCVALRMKPRAPVRFHPLQGF
jgi:hypothetical protein